jgi:hypothetical protein
MIERVDRGVRRVMLTERLAVVEGVEALAELMVPALGLDVHHGDIGCHSYCALR